MERRQQIQVNGCYKAQLELKSNLPVLFFMQIPLSFPLQAGQCNPHDVCSCSKDPMSRSVSGIMVGIYSRDSLSGTVPGMKCRDLSQRPLSVSEPGTHCLHLLQEPIVGICFRDLQSRCSRVQQPIAVPGTYCLTQCFSIGGCGGRLEFWR